MSGSAMDWWGFAAAAKRAVHNALAVAGFNPGNRAGDVAAKAVLSLIQGDGVRLDKMYDSIGIPPKRTSNPTIDMPVCTAKCKVTVHDQEFRQKLEFWVEKSWMKDPREKHFNAVERITYIENLLYAHAYMEAAARRAEMIQEKGPITDGEETWSADWQISIEQWSELPENTRSVS